MAQRLTVFKDDEDMPGGRYVTDIFEREEGKDNLRVNLRYWKGKMRKHLSGEYTLMVEDTNTHQKLYEARWHTDKRLSTKGRDYITRADTKAWRRRQLVHAHNGLRGSVSMARSMCIKVIKAETTTQNAKRLASKIQVLIEDLQQLLKVRTSWSGELADDTESNNKRGIRCESLSDGQSHS